MQEFYLFLETLNAVTTIWCIAYEEVEVQRVRWSWHWRVWKPQSFYLHVP